jgi:predicted dehydrogenase
MQLGLIGYGNIARKHLEVFRALGCEVVASCNRSEKGNKLASTEGGILHTYPDFRTMLESHDLDGLVVCASYDQLFQLAQDLIPYKIPLLLEKPAGTSLQELETLIALQDEHGTVVQVAYNRRHYDLLHKVIADMGGLEQLTAVQIEWSENPAKVKHQRNYSDAQIADLIIGNSIHGIDTMMHLVGPVKEMAIFTQDFGGFFRWQMQACGKSESGVLFNFQSSWDNPVPWRIVLSSQGSRYVFAPLETCKKTSSDNTTTELLPDDNDLRFKAGFYHQAQHFIKVASQKQAAHPHDLRSARQGMRLAGELTKAFVKSQKPIFA